MPAGSPLVLRVLAGVAGAVLVAGAVTVAAQEGTGSGPGVGAPATPSAAGAPSPPTTAPATRPGSPSTTAPPAQTGSSGAAGLPSTTTTPHPLPVAPLATVAGAVPDPGQPTPTATGQYRYRVSSTGGRDGPSSGTMTEQVRTESAGAGVTRQSVIDSEPGQAQGGSPDQGNATQEVQWDARGYVQLATTISAGGQTVHCVWNPSILELAAPLAIGRQWAFAGSCPVTVFGQPGTVQLTGQASVSGSQRVSVGADAVPVWVIADDYTVVVHVPSLGINATIHQVATDKVAGRLGLIVEEDATDTFTFGGRTDTSTNRQVLVSIHPT